MNSSRDSRRKRRKRSVLKNFERRSKVGDAPGTLDRTDHPITEHCRIVRLSYNADRAEERELSSLSELQQLRDPTMIHWISVIGIPDAATMEELGRAFGLHVLALEDVLNAHQRCKVEDYPESLFVVIRIPVQDSDAGLTTEQVSLFLGHNFVISVSGHRFEQTRDRILTARGRIREMQADYLAYTMLDTVIDNYFPVIEQLGDRLNHIDEALETHFSPQHRLEIRDVRSDLLVLRRAIWPQREAIAALQRDETPLISDAARTYLRDCYDHTIQLMDVIETYRELCADLRDFYVAELGVYNNEVMKTLTIIATLFMPLSFIAGFYGMNFQHMPELTWRLGYPITIGLMLIVTSGLLLWFRRRKWI
ncbi:MAG: magnesium/cobalt transporter CorA [Planctomycetaceae bacterium]|nr:magnesium/cobalt transporter CorA [Planctomycetaceae bacterium]